MSNYNQTPNQNKNSTTTNGQSFANFDTLDRLDLNYTDNKIWLNFGKFLKTPDGYKRDESNVVKTSITNTTVTNILEECDEIIASIKETGTFIPSGIPCGYTSNNMVEISNGSNINREPGIYLVLYRNIDSNKTTDDITIFKFATTISIKNYNASTGKGDIKSTDITEFKQFRRVLNEFAKGSTKALAHSIREADKFDKLKQLNALSAVCTHMGINLFSNKSYNKGTSPFNSDTKPTNFSMDDSDYETSPVELNLDLEIV